MTRQSLACLVGLSIGAAAFVLVSYPYRILAAAVLGLAGTLALWPLGSGQQPAVKREIRVFGRRRMRELEAEVARLTARIERGEFERGQLVGALRGLDQWADAQELRPQADKATTTTTRSADGRGGAIWRSAGKHIMQQRLGRP